MRRTGKCLVILLVFLLLAACSRPYRFYGSPYDRAEPAGEISGTNWDNTPFRLSDLRGKIALVFFGYTFCPDVCPTTLAEMRVLVQDLGDKAGDVAVVFVSVDPERDTPARLGEYVPVFNPTFYGVHVPLDELEPVKAAYGVVAEKNYYDEADSAAGYSVDHTARVYLIDPAGNLRLSFGYGTPVEDIRSDIEYILQQ